MKSSTANQQAGLFVHVFVCCCSLNKSEYFMLCGAVLNTGGYCMYDSITCISNIVSGKNTNHHAFPSFPFIGQVCYYSAPYLTCRTVSFNLHMYAMHILIVLFFWSRYSSYPHHFHLLWGPVTSLLPLRWLTSFLSTSFFTALSLFLLWILSLPQSLWSPLARGAFGFPGIRQLCRVMPTEQSGHPRIPMWWYRSPLHGSVCSRKSKEGSSGINESWD